MAEEKYACCLIVDIKKAKAVKDLLEERNFLRKEYRITKVDSQTLAIPVSFKNTQHTQEPLQDFGQVEIRYINTQQLAKAKFEKPEQKLRAVCKQHLDSLKIGENRDQLLKEVPKKWDIHEDLVMFHDNSFVSDVWDTEAFWTKVAEVFAVKRVAVKSRISGDGFRTPIVQLRLGVDGWVTHVDNGVTYTLDVTKNMFSKGNITEKLRVSLFNCKDEVVVDLFAGIGYFTLPYLVHAQALHVYACEWNPDAVNALQRNLHLNGVAHRCTVLSGDNRQVAPVNVADRVNLGLIPTSRLSWRTACTCFKTSGGLLHVHENVSHDSIDSCSCRENACIVKNAYRNKITDSKRNTWCIHLKDCLRLLNEYEPRFAYTIEHIELVKSYAPRIDHLVFDVKCIPK